MTGVIVLFLWIGLAVVLPLSQLWRALRRLEAGTGLEALALCKAWVLVLAAGWALRGALRATLLVLGDPSLTCILSFEATVLLAVYMADGIHYRQLGLRELAVELAPAKRHQDYSQVVRDGVAFGRSLSRRLSSSFSSISSPRNCHHHRRNSDPICEENMSVDKTMQKNKKALEAMLEEVKASATDMTGRTAPNEVFCDVPLLHYAVWLSSSRQEPGAETVRLVLDTRCAFALTTPRDSDEAMFVSYLYKMEDGNVCSLEAIHIAVLLGNIPALDALERRSIPRIDLSCSTAPELGRSESLLSTSNSTVDTFKMDFAPIHKGKEFSLPYDRGQARRFAMLVPGDPRFFVGYVDTCGKSVNGAVGDMLMEADPKHPTLFQVEDGQIKVPLREDGEVDVDHCQYRLMHTKLFERAKQKPGSLIEASKEEMGGLQDYLLYAAARVHPAKTYNDSQAEVNDRTGVAFLSIFREEKRPLPQTTRTRNNNVAMVYAVGPKGKADEGSPAPSTRDFIQEVRQTGENVIALLLEYNRSVDCSSTPSSRRPSASASASDAESEHAPIAVPKIDVVRLPIVAGGNFKHPDVQKHNVALALLWGVHAALDSDAKFNGSSESDQLAVELMVSMQDSNMQEAYRLYTQHEQTLTLTPELRLANRDVIKRIRRRSSMALGSTVPSRIISSTDPSSPSGGTFGSLQSLHLAAKQGHRETVSWLLHHDADPNAFNDKGQSPLHIIALLGAGADSKSEAKLDMRRKGEDLEVIVKELVARKARLDSKAPGLGNDQALKTPLEIASQSARSSFPKHLLHLLAPSLQPEEAGEGPGRERKFTILEDMCIVAGNSTEAAEALARRIIEDDALQQCLLFEVQATASSRRAPPVDLLAKLLRLAPRAAVDVLEVLTDTPHVEDQETQPLQKRASLWGFVRDYPMRCAYQPDAVQMAAGPRDILWPCWKREPDPDDDDSNHHHCGKCGAETEWQRRLVEAAEENSTDERQNYMYDVATRVVLLPNVLDIDIFKALSVLWSQHNKLFARLPVQGILNCAWDHIVWIACVWDLSMQIVDWLMICVWGLYGGRIICRFNHVWMLAGFLREMVDTLWWFNEHVRKWLKHSEVPDEDIPTCCLMLGFWGIIQEIRSIFAKLRPVGASQHPASSSQGNGAALAVLWHPLRFFTDSSAIMPILFLVLRGWFVFCVSLWGANVDEHKSVVALFTWFQGMRILLSTRMIYSFTGSTVVAVVGTMNLTVFELLAVVLWFFFSSGITLRIMHHHASSDPIFLQLFTGVVFGEGDGLNLLGLGAGPVQYDRLIFGVVVTVLMVFCWMNLVTAVFGNEYDRVKKEAPLLFYRERAKRCCRYLLSYQKIHLAPVKHERRRADEERFDRLVALACVAMVVAVSSLGILSLFGKSKFFIVVAACSITFAQEVLLANLMQSEWFPPAAGEWEGPEPEHFLWICHRADWSQDHYICEDIEKEDLQNLDVALRDQLQSAQDTVLQLQAQRFAAVEEKLAHLLELSHLGGGAAASRAQNKFRAQQRKSSGTSGAPSVAPSTANTPTARGGLRLPMMMGRPRPEAMGNHRLAHQLSPQVPPAFFGMVRTQSEH